MQHAQKFINIVREAKKLVKETNIAAVKQKLDNQENFHLVDVREESEFAQYHLPNALHLGKGVIERDIEKAIPNTSDEIILYCGGGSRSALAAENLQKMGYTNVFSMDGGIRGWAEAGYPLVKNSR